jgi:hypothetical protein
MKTKIIVLLLLFVLGSTKLNAQNSEWQRYLEEMSDREDVDTESLADLFEELSQLAENPYNLQTVTKQQLEKLPFLTAIQIENLLYYQYKYQFATVYELKNVEDLDLQTITYLLPFVYVGEIERQVRLRNHQELSVRANRTVQEKAGYRKKTYLGDPYYMNFRYTGDFQEKIQLGISGEKDAGEAFGKQGLDYYTWNLKVKNLGFLEEIHFGNYRAAFGQGLVMNTNFSLGKTSDVININHKSGGIGRHISMNESQYFSGVAGTMHVNHFRLHVFYSSRNLDANANDSTIITIKTDGLHRTYNDLQKLHAGTTQTFGGHLQYQKDNLTLGLTGIYYEFGGKTLNPNLQPYNVFYLRGKNHYNTSLDYQYQTKKANLQGEIALDNSGKIATIHNLQLQPASMLDWVISLRYYDRQYNALYGKGFSESTGIQNETGVYTGLKIRPLAKWELSAYVDYFQFPWLKYGINTPSSGTDALVQIHYSTNEKIKMVARYKFKEKQKNILPYTTQQLRYQFKYDFNSQLNFQTQVDYKQYAGGETRSQAYSLTQLGSYIPAPKFQIDGGFGYFKTDDWDTRISVHEKNVLYASDFPNYYGHGFRYYAVVKWNPMKRLTVYLKCGSTHYLDRDVISSGDEEITGKEKTDIYCLLKYNF